MNRLPDMDQRDLDHDIAPVDETAFPCACGDEKCIGHDDDKGNIKIGNAWYASDCVMANHHPEVVRERELDAIYEESRR